MALRKYDLINGLARQYGLTRYLEICTPTTGVKFGFVDQALFTVRDRLMYRCPDAYDDGLEIAFRTTAETSHELIRVIQRLQPAEGRYDLVFVDPWHSYASSLSDMHGALSLLRPGGIIVVHDCNPTDPDTVGPEFRDGAWCGVTYQAFVDFVLSAQAAGHCVVDTDYGCGIVLTADVLPNTVVTSRPDRRTVFEWAVARGSADTRYPFFDRNRAGLLNLVDAFDFAEACGIPQPAPAPVRPATRMPDPPAAADSALSLVVDGEILALAGYDDGWHRYALPQSASDIRVRSASASPADRVPPSPDRRILGLAVAGVKVGGVSIDLSDPALGEGWYIDEAAAGYPWRWTDGNARLRLPKGTETVELFTVNRVP